ncbi:hypothetical protein ACFXPR_36280 [Nocardia tengchongensis]|uniref:hypothetical protein n=1 Tax=Nocardia tengchongensis TaxID=2055889 RepID=UPI0036C69152
MSVDSASTALADSAWTVFWFQLPVLVLAVAVIIVATLALWRARPEDVPKVFEAFTTAFGRQRRGQRQARRQAKTEEAPR